MTDPQSLPAGAVAAVKRARDDLRLLRDVLGQQPHGSNLWKLGNLAMAARDDLDAALLAAGGAR